MDQRKRRGTIEFDLPEPQLTFDSEGVVSGIIKAERHFSNRIIEEFMIATNEVLARTLGRSTWRLSIAYTTPRTARRPRSSRNWSPS